MVRDDVRLIVSDRGSFFLVCNLFQISFSSAYSFIGNGNAIRQPRDFACRCGTQEPSG